MADRIKSLKISLSTSAMLHLIFNEFINRNSSNRNLKGYCTVFQHASKSLEITASVLSDRMSKTARNKYQSVTQL